MHISSKYHWNHLNHSGPVQHAVSLRSLWSAQRLQVHLMTLQPPFFRVWCLYCYAVWFHHILSCWLFRSLKHTTVFSMFDFLETEIRDFFVFQILLSRTSLLRHFSSNCSGLNTKQELMLLHWFLSVSDQICQKIAFRIFKFRVMKDNRNNIRYSLPAISRNLQIHCFL